jgi:hypothetical protein
MEARINSAQDWMSFWKITSNRPVTRFWKVHVEGLTWAFSFVFTLFPAFIKHLNIFSNIFFHDIFFCFLIVVLVKSLRSRAKYKPSAIVGQSMSKWSRNYLQSKGKRNLNQVKLKIKSKKTITKCQLNKSNCRVLFQDDHLLSDVKI